MKAEVINPLLIWKYNQPVPRYTSYPTVPNWNEHIEAQDWENNFKARFNDENHVNGISLYLHLPFCESLCTYCGCNKKITTNHKVENDYIKALLDEWEMYKGIMEEAPVVRELHLGGGTPTFFSPENLNMLLDGILGNSKIHSLADF